MTLREVAKTGYRQITKPVGSIQEIRTTADHFVLTYDDGPDPKNTPQILNVLQEFDATATFFVLLSKVNKSPELLREVAAAGHEIALHGIDHQRLTNFSGSAVYHRTKAGKDELEDLLGIKIQWMRPPYGAQTLSSWRAIRKSGLTPVMWSATMWDWKDVSHEARVAKAVSTAAPGAILLGHDSFPGVDDGVPARPEPTVNRPKLAHDVLAAYADHGLHARSVSDLLRQGSAKKWAWFAR
jgi:peptidoglycan/xylan/chitin deacetylase (PgdA/CDA1 family)